ncbi:MAG: DNA polymerase III subunit gamma/tau [Patescibacteria group bacterium]|nr:DNA polymerase III subunit gamma/tau [Patescibacteria group bacterium]
MLYQKYRPQKFNDLVGQDYIKEILLNAVRLHKISHAYLFSGPRGTGKTTTARLLAKALNCLSPKSDGEPCNKCLNCEAIKIGKHMDLIEIDAASNTGIDDIRELRSKIMLATSQGRYKVYIIDEVHMLSKAAFNGLLKTLEEPPANVIFILATTEPYDVPETILSRCQRFDFKPLDVTELTHLVSKVARQEKIKIDKEVAQLIAIYSQGSSRDALSFLEQINSLRKPITLEKAKRVLGVIDFGSLVHIFDALIAKDKLVFELIKTELAKGYSVSNLINGLLKYLEDLIFIKNVGVPVSPTTKELVAKIKKQSDQISNADLTRIFNLLIEARYLARDLDPENLPLEITILKYIGKEPNLNNLEQERPDSSHSAQAEKIVLEEKKEKSKITSTIKQDFDENDLEKNVKLDKKISNFKINEADFDENWQKVIVELKKFNHSIATFLNKANARFHKGKILVEVPFGLYQKILTQPKNNQKIHKVVHSIFHKPLGLEIYLKDSKGAEAIKKAFGI